VVPCCLLLSLFYCILSPLVVPYTSVSYRGSVQTAHFSSSVARWLVLAFGVSSFIMYPYSTNRNLGTTPVRHSHLPGMTPPAHRPTYERSQSAQGGFALVSSPPSREPLSASSHNAWRGHTGASVAHSVQHQQHNSPTVSDTLLNMDFIRSAFANAPVGGDDLELTQLWTKFQALEPHHKAIDGELLTIQKRLMARVPVAGGVGGGVDTMSDDVSAMSISVQGALDDDMSGVSRTLSHMSGVEVHHGVEEPVVQVPTPRAYVDVRTASLATIREVKGIKNLAALQLCSYSDLLYISYQMKTGGFMKNPEYIRNNGGMPPPIKTTGATNELFAQLTFCLQIEE